MKIAEQFAKESDISNHQSVISHQSEKALLSEKFTKHALLKDFDSPFSIDMDLYPEFKYLPSTHISVKARKERYRLT